MGCEGDLKAAKMLFDVWAKINPEDEWGRERKKRVGNMQKQKAQKRPL